MTDNALFALVRAILLAELGQGWAVERKYQPLSQGVNSAPTVYLFKVADKTRGSPQRRYAWDEAGQLINTEDVQQYETTFQAAVHMDETTDPDAQTPSDAANHAAAIMQSDAALTALRAAGVGILRVADVVNPYNVNDRERFDAAPSFDFVLTYQRVRRSTVPHVVGVEATVNRV